eukprot:scaffold204223_cov33-Tisochrysis_lutea.AAC.2
MTSVLGPRPVELPCAAASRGHTDGWLEKAETYLAHYFGSATDVAEMFADAVSSTTQTITSEESLSSYFGAANDVAEILAEVAKPASNWETRDAHPAAVTTIRPSYGVAVESRQGRVVVQNPLEALPIDSLHQILSHCCARTLIRAAQTSRALYEAVNCDEHWRTLWKQRYGELCSSIGLDDFPRATESWRSFYFSFGSSWASRAYTEKGRVIIKIDGIWYDATPIVADHPGGPALLLASAGLDATKAFDYTSHSVRFRSLGA